MKRAILIFLFTALLTNLYATFWYGQFFQFPHFEYNENELTGGEPNPPYMYIASIRLNSYIKHKVKDGYLQDKPVRYSVNDYMSTDWERKRLSLEVYQTDNAYYININQIPTGSIPLFSEKELKDIIDYFAHPDFEPFYCDTTMLRFQLAREIFLNKIEQVIDDRIEIEDTTPIEVYTEEDLSIKYINDEFEVFWGSKKIDLNLTYPIAKPIKFNDRIIIIDSKRFFVIEDGDIVKNVTATEILWDGSDMSANSNIPNIQIFPDWLNIYSKSDDSAIYSYSYSQNRFYNLKQY